ncbi:unnamed protein product [Mytilus edulis]|uniref:Uncharacterized protein n=1 Tax=Mytilus edulis TaxID=6550 RepID=A0A8S3U1H1_MYTED|nr:unnamed protein product [Mytilus edulis]
MYPEFITLLNNYDVVCFDETKLDDLDTVELDNFIFHFKNRKKYSNRKSGGIAFGYKRYLENCDSNSRSRTASLQDFNAIVDTDDFLVQHLIDINEFSNVDILDKLGILRKRHSTDLNVNTYGRKLIQFCKNNNMYIMNGRIGNDEVELKMETTVDFHRAHRFGKETEFRDKKDGRLIKTRPIVCRFKNFKDREIVRTSAKELKGTHYGIQEQFPKEINDKRKMLWPYFKQAREDKKKAYLKRDKLFIDGNEFILPDDDEMETNDDKRNYETQNTRPKTTPHREPQRQTQRSHIAPRRGRRH